VSNSCVAMLRLTEEKCSEKYLKMLIGRTEIEDALKRLEKLTNEEVRMATAQVLETTDDINNRVAGVDHQVGVVIGGA
jgi:hypothetical protein